MTDRTRQEIRQVLAYLHSGGKDRAGALKGLNDWFCESLFEEGYMGEAMKDRSKDLSVDVFKPIAEAFKDCETRSVAIGKPLREVRRGHPKFYPLLEELADLHERKNQNYATGEDPLMNLRECEGLGISAFNGTLVRLCDKWGRIKRLASGVPDLVGESIIDTLKDMAIYALLAIILWEEKQDVSKEVRATDSAGNRL